MKTKFFYTLAFLCFQASLMFGQLIQFPTGSQLNIVNGKLEYQLPAGYVMTGTLVSNPDFEMSIGGTGGGSVTCNCTSGDGDCQPSRYGDTAGCGTTGGSCRTCVATSTKLMVGTDNALLTNLRIKPEAPYIVNALSSSTRVYPLTTNDGSNPKPSVTASILNVAENRSAISAIYSQLLTPENLAVVQRGEIPANHKLSPFIIGGAVGFLVLPDAAIGVRGTVGIGGTAKYSCSGCSGSCKHDSTMGVHYCEGCSSGCTLSW